MCSVFVCVFVCGRRKGCVRTNHTYRQQTFAISLHYDMRKSTNDIWQRQKTLNVLPCFLQNSQPNSLSICPRVNRCFFVSHSLALTDSLSPSANLDIKIRCVVHFIFSLLPYHSFALRTTHLLLTTFCAAFVK